ncbi:putative chaperone protein ClpB [Iris pallida]|uniref:Chaperone protein ClpB n=1 Tax=Iris pallida TaxID=29817 RepID=A0AAX6EZ61_IRIPA|nr:putative chaperone protein ClpB [Iris pallida]
MRAGLSTIQQTLAPEAASVLTSSIAEAAKRNHGQTTPLHVAATLLSSPGGLLRQACVRSHPNSSHPLQCRALELCFSVALDRLPSVNPTSSGAAPSVAEPPISNALMAALKRAQAHQRRGCPEQQQSPLLAVKVDLEQFVVSILDDPSVSRVMKEASFSSPAVKASIEQSLAPPSHRPTSATVAPRSLYLNPRLQQQQQKLDSKPDGGSHRKAEVNKVLEILMRSKKHNPVLVGDSDLNSVAKEVMERIKTGELGCSPQIISLEEEVAPLVSDTTRSRLLLPSKIRELGTDIDTRIGSGSSVVIDLGDLKWLVESGAAAAASGPNRIQQQQATSETGRAAVAEMADIVRKFGDAGAGGGRVWLIGTATCATYLRCQVYHPDMESEWDLQALPIAPRSPLPGLFNRLGNTNGILSSSFRKNGILSSSVEALTSPMAFPRTKQTTVPLRRPPETTADTSQRQTLSPRCNESYERELSKLAAKEFEKSSSASRPEPSPALPKWLQIAAPCASKASELNYKQSMEEQLKQWRQNCSPLHPNSSNPRLFEPSLSLAQGLALDQPASPPRSPVKTDLVLGNSKPPDTSSSWEDAHRDRIRGFHGCKKDGLSDQKGPKLSSFEDTDSLKRLFKGLNEKVGWQSEAASAITSAIMQSKSGNGKRRGGVMPKADTWLLFVGPDKVGKRRMAVALSDLVFGTAPVIICLGSPGTDGDDGESDIDFRGKTPLDRIASAVRRNPFSVIVLENIDQADAVVRGTIKQAINKGRLPDSYGKEVSLGSAIFVLTTNWLPDELKSSMEDSVIKMEEKILSSANCSWQLELSIRGKRQPEWLSKTDQPEKRRKEFNGLGLSLDLNLAAGGSGDEDGGESSVNSSDITVENDNEHGRLAIQRSHSTSSASEFLHSVDKSVVFKPVDFGPMRRSISESISAKFVAVIGAGRSVQVDDDVLDQVVGRVWLSGVRFEEWAEGVLVPSIEQLRGNLSEEDDGTAIWLTKTAHSSKRLRREGRGPEIVCRKVSHWQ